jgi:hypothetical protein
VGLSCITYEAARSTCRTMTYMVHTTATLTPYELQDRPSHTCKEVTFTNWKQMRSGGRWLHFASSTMGFGHRDSICMQPIDGDVCWQIPKDLPSEIDLHKAIHVKNRRILKGMQAGVVKWPHAPCSRCLSAWDVVMRARSATNERPRPKRLKRRDATWRPSAS